MSPVVEQPNLLNEGWQYYNHLISNGASFILCYESRIEQGLVDDEVKPDPAEYKTAAAFPVPNLQGSPLHTLKRKYVQCTRRTDVDWEFYDLCHIYAVFSRPCLKIRLDDNNVKAVFDMVIKGTPDAYLHIVIRDPPGGKHELRKQRTIDQVGYPSDPENFAEEFGAATRDADTRKNDRARDRMRKNERLQHVYEWAMRGDKSGWIMENQEKERVKALNERFAMDQRQKQAAADEPDSGDNSSAQRSVTETRTQPGRKATNSPEPNDKDDATEGANGGHVSEGITSSIGGDMAQSINNGDSAQGVQDDSNSDLSPVPTPTTPQTPIRKQFGALRLPKSQSGSRGKSVKFVDDETPPTPSRKQPRRKAKKNGGDQGEDGSDE
ncbi:MAG: hypothetical protein M1831_007365 [Alyxoria varia]|nr:MAG: hypothetical protein M1831_007365 [Alyxoria varia]